MLKHCWETEGLELKRPCLNSVLDMDPENEPATSALLLFDQSRPESWVLSLRITDTPAQCHNPLQALLSVSTR
jgi:hypothetical protein